MASVLGAQDEFGDGRGVGRAPGAESAAEAWPMVGTAALTELNCRAAPATAPKVIPPTRTASLPTPDLDIVHNFFAGGLVL